MLSKVPLTREMVMGFMTGLQLVFVTLKLTHYVSWSWLWILSPTWVPFGLMLVFALLALIEKRAQKRRVDDALRRIK